MSDLFVIGAGASVPYGFPTGEELMGIMKNLKPTPEEEAKFSAMLKNENGYVKDELEQEERLKLEIFRIGASNYNLAQDRDGVLNQLNTTQAPSIDDFLRNKIAYNDINNMTRKILARVILFYERICHTRKTKSAINWIQYLCNYIDRGGDGNLYEYFLKSKYVTFNYDRVFEYNISNYLTNEKHLQNVDAVRIIKNEMSIIHVNGSLGSLNELEFGSKSLRGLDKANIRTVWDKKDDYSINICDSVNKHIMESDRIFFLGFGYLDKNLEVLGIKDMNKITNIRNNILSGKKVYGTVYGLFDNKISNIMELINSCGASILKLHEDEVEELIKRYFDV